MKPMEIMEAIAATTENTTHKITMHNIVDVEAMPFRHITRSLSKSVV